MTQPSDHTLIPDDFDPSDFGAIEPLLVELHEREIGSDEALQQWLSDFSQLSDVLDEYGTHFHAGTAGGAIPEDFLRNAAFSFTAD